MAANKQQTPKPVRCAYSGCNRMFVPTTGTGIGRAGRPQKYCPSTTPGKVSECAAKAGQERYWERWRKVVKAAKKAANKNGKGKETVKPRPMHKAGQRGRTPGRKPGGNGPMGTQPLMADVFVTKKGTVAPPMMARESIGKSLGDRARELKEKFRPKGNG